jgi:ABC-2 type transport system permease protein
VTRTLALTRLEVWRQILTWSGSWWFVVTLAAQEAIAPLLGLFIWTAVAPGPQVATYYVALLAVGLATASYENHTLSNGIYDGNVTHELLKPRAVWIAVAGENLAIRVWLMLVGIPLLAVAIAAFEVTFAWTHLLLALPALVLAAILRFLFSWVLALSAFWTERAHATMNFGGVLIFLLGGSAAPVPFLPEPMRSIASALPFRAMLGFPAELATGTVRGAEILLGFAYQLGWIALVALLAVVSWRLGVRRFTSVGG